jgi:hypothetical protein
MKRVCSCLSTDGEVKNRWGYIVLHFFALLHDEVHSYVQDNFTVVFSTGHACYEVLLLFVLQTRLAMPKVVLTPRMYLLNPRAREELYRLGRS